MIKFHLQTAAQFAAMRWPCGKLLYVDGTNGSDAQGGRGKPVAFATITAAKAVALSGDVIIIGPGEYDENDLLNWPSADGNERRLHFMPGARIVRDYSTTAIKNGVAVYQSVFDDNGEALTCKISGFGEFHFDYGTADWNNDEGLPVPCNTNRFGLLKTDNEGTSVLLQYRDCTYEGYADAGVQMVYIHDCEFVKLEGPRMASLNETSEVLIGEGESNGPGTATDLFGGIWWAKGETHVNIPHIKAGAYSVYPEGTGVASETNIWVKSQLIESSNAATIYFNGVSNANYKMWIEADEIRASGAFNNALHIQGDGKVYITAKKIGAASGTVGYAEAKSANGLEFWLTAQKLAGALGVSNLLSIGGSNNHPVTAYIRVQHYQDVGADGGGTTAFIATRGSATKNYVFGGVVVCNLNRRGINHIAGETFAQGLRIECDGSNDADNRPVVVSAAGLVLDGCTLLAPALAAESIYAAAPVAVKIYGTCFANKDKHANVTIQVGTLTVDAALVT
jgi:hypothetical protein